MEDVFSKVTAIILGCILMFIVPVYIWKQTQNQTIQTYIYTESVKFVDAVCNKGIITDEVYMNFKEDLMKSGKICNVSLERYTNNRRDIYYTKQIEKSLEENGRYELIRRDFLRLQITDKEGRVIAFYGGSIKDEDY